MSKPRKKVPPTFYFWLACGTGHKKEFKLRGNNEEEVFSDFIDLMNRKWGFTIEDMERWLEEAKNKRSW